MHVLPDKFQPLTFDRVIDRMHNLSWRKYMLENTEGVIKNGQFRETNNIGYTMRAAHHYAQANTI